jgi:hypothetical protein
MCRFQVCRHQSAGDGPGSDDGSMHVDRIEGDILPQSLTDILANDEEATKLAKMQSENVEEDDEIDNRLDEILEHESDDDE